MHPSPELLRLLQSAQVEADRLKEMGVAACDFATGALYRDVGDCVRKALRLLAEGSKDQVPIAEYEEVDFTENRFYHMPE